MITTKTILDNLSHLKQVTFEVTESCNLNCKYCGLGDVYEYDCNRNNVNISFAMIKNVLDYLIRIWKEGDATKEDQTYISFYGGEPLLNYQVICDTISYLKSIDIPQRLIYSMTTNAMLLDKYMDSLVENDIHLLISLDGDKKGNGYRVDKSGHSSFDRVYANIKALENKYPEYFKTNVNINSVLHKLNEVEGVFSFVKREFGKEPNISELNNSSISIDKEEIFMDMYKVKADSIKNSKNPKELSESLFIGDPNVMDLSILIHKHSGNVFETYNDLLIDPQKKSTAITGTCTPFGKKMFVNARGAIIQCERIGRQYILGNVNEQNVTLDVDQIVEKYNSYITKFQKQCASCWNNRSCSQCMYFIDKLDTDNPVCHAYTTKKDFSIKVQENLSFLHDNPHLYEKIMNEVNID